MPGFAYRRGHRSHHVEAPVVVASIDTYLKYSEAAGQSVPVARPALESRPYDACGGKSDVAGRIERGGRCAASGSAASPSGGVVFHGEENDEVEGKALPQAVRAIRTEDRCQGAARNSRVTPGRRGTGGGRCRPGKVRLLRHSVG